jgi:hypothetical protein
MLGYKLMQLSLGIEPNTEFQPLDMVTMFETLNALYVPSSCDILHTSFDEH